MLEGGTQNFRNTKNLGKSQFPGGWFVVDARTVVDRDFYNIWYDGNFGGDRKVWLSYQKEDAKTRSYQRNPGSGGPFIESDNNPKITNQILDGRISTPLPLGNTLVIGGLWTKTKLEAINGGGGTELETFSVAQWALFAENEWKIFDNLGLTVGVRRDDHDVYGDHWSPRGYLVFNATDAITFKGGVSTGFRAPEIRAIAPGFAYPTRGGSDVIVTDPNNPLKPETSTNYELSAHYESRGFDGSVTLFNTNFKDKIETIVANDGAGGQARWPVNPSYGMWYWVNLEKARTRGVEVTGRWNIADAFTISSGYTFTDSEQRSGDFKGWPLMRTPKHSGNLRFDWRHSEVISIWGAAYYHGKELNAGARVGDEGKLVTEIPDPAGGPWALGSVRSYAAYATADIGASFRLAPQVQWNVAVYNLTDKELKQNVHAQVDEGRRFWTGLTLRF